MKIAVERISVQYTCQEAVRPESLDHARDRLRRVSGGVEG